MTKKKGRDKKKTNKKKPAMVTKAETPPSNENAPPAGPFEYKLDTGLSFTDYARPYSIFVNMKMEDGTEKPVGRIVGRFICRNNIRDAFWDRIQDVSPAAAALGFDVFDRHGNTRDEFVSGVKRGTGVWTGSEMHSQCFLLFESVAIDGTIEDTTFIGEMFHRYFSHGKDLHDGLVLALIQPCSPACGPMEDQTEEKDMTVGDQKVGDVPASKLKEEAQENDTTSEACKVEDVEVSVENETEEMEQKELGIQWNSLETKMQLVRTFGFRRIGTSSWFGKAYEEKHPARLLKAEDDYDPPDDLPEPSDLERFENELERTRTLKEHGTKWKDISDRFVGFSEEQTNKLLSLKGVESPVPAHVFTQAKFGCTCNKCINGILSPRMYFTLVKQAGKAYQQLYMDMSCDSTRQRLARNPLLLEKSLVGVLLAPQPTEIIAQVFAGKDFALGTSNVFRYIHELLKQKQLPSVNNIKSAVRDAENRLVADPCPCCGGENISPAMGVAVYLMGGGTLKACLKGLVDYSARRDEKAGDDTFHWRDNKFKGWDFAREYHALPRCRNDSEFGFVLKMLCKS